jgi:hypothetical protein
MDDFHATRKGDVLSVETRGEFITRVIGKNRFIAGMSVGILSGFFSKEAELIECSQDMEKSSYVVRFTGKDNEVIKHKSGDDYNRLNGFGLAAGPDLKSMLRKKLFSMEGNAIYFRNARMLMLESTLFHLMGASGLMMDRVPAIACKVFRESLGGSKDIVMLKNLLQITGWGRVSIAQSRNNITVSISNQPYGLQHEMDNWDFLSGVILGYIRAFDQSARMKSARAYPRRLVFSYSTSGS